MSRIYISGPMSGYPDFNRPVFHATARKLRDQGFTVVNPAELDANDPPVVTLEWADYLRRDIVALMSCDEICLLPGWSDSRGAQLELSIARALGMPIRFSMEFAR